MYIMYIVFEGYTKLKIEVFMKDAIKALATKINSEEERKFITNEAQTRSYFIEPLLEILGYDTRNPREVIPEFSADYGNKKAAKVDYAILVNKPLNPENIDPDILVECKHWDEDLKNHEDQLERYFNTGKTNAKLGILTNGVQYRFYTDIDKDNNLDPEPFLIFDFENYKDNLIEALEIFRKNDFDEKNMREVALKLKNTEGIKNIIKEQFSNPSEEFIKFIAKQVNAKRLQGERLNEFRETIITSFSQLIGEKADSILNKLKEGVSSQNTENQFKEKPKIVTTSDEIDGLNIIKAIVRKKIPLTDLIEKDTQSYFAISYKKQYQPICRLHFNNEQKYIGILDSSKKEIRYKINSLDDIYNYESNLLGSIKSYE